MFSVTFLGHQGWLVESPSTRLLVDPVLGRRLVGTPDDPIELYPPRAIDLAAFPPIDGLIVSHEHPDHLNLPTLLRLDRSVPVFVPGRASVAARAIVEELGFRARALQSGRTERIGDLEVHPFHCTELARDEWDVLPLLVRDAAGNGSFATCIDAPESAAFARFAIERAGRVGVWASSHNYMDLSVLQEGGVQEPDERVVMRLARDFADRFERQFRGSLQPGVFVVLGGAFSLTGDLAWMNRHIHAGAADDIAALLTARSRGVTVRSPLPGDRFVFAGGRLVDQVRGTPFLSTLARSEWPARGAEPFSGKAPDYAPATGRREATKDDEARLVGELESFARHLYGSALMRSLYVDGEPARVGFRVRTRDGSFALVYRPESCSFERGDEADRALDAGLECWASDLLGILRLEVNAGFVLLGRSRSWNRMPNRVRNELGDELVLYTHPLRRPAETLEAYRRTVALLGEPEGPRLRGTGATAPMKVAAS